jgi:hypothetical protein
MEPEGCKMVFTPPRSLGALIVSQVRFLRESLAEILAQASGIEVRGQSATLADALVAAEALRPAIVLLDAAFPSGMAAVARLTAVILKPTWWCSQLLKPRKTCSPGPRPVSLGMSRIPRR